MKVSAIESAWNETLGLSRSQWDRTFADLGGTSLQANLLVARLSRELGIQVPVLRVFEFPTLRLFARHLTGAAIEALADGPMHSSEEAVASDREGERLSQGEIRAEDVAIIGMGCRFPGANSVDEFWSNLVAGKDSIRILSKDELDPEIPASLREDPRYVRARGMIDRPLSFDAGFFEVNPIEAKLVDPQHRILLEIAYDALEASGEGTGLDPRREERHARTGVFAGVEDNTYYKTEILPFPDAEARAGRFSVMTGNEKDYVAMRIAHKLNLRGPAVSVHTACSTSLVAVIMACKSLRSGECDLAVAGGSTVHFPTHDGYYFQEGGVFSSDGHCRPFDESAEGTNFTDGAGVVVLKRLRDAIRDGNPIHAVIKGGAINNDGRDKIAFSAPSISGQSRCISDALADSGVNPETIQFLEAHGTATPVGDPIEVEALRQAYRRHTDKKQFCGIGSVKGNIGHTTAAAGVASLIKMALALKREKMPPTVHFKKPNPGLDIESSPFYVVSKLTDWRPRAGQVRRCGLSSFGIGGTNSHVILEEAPPRPAAVVAARPFEILPVSAKTPAQRDLLLKSAATLLENGSAGASVEALRDLAHTLQTGRTELEVRGAVVRRRLSPSPAASGVESPKDVIVKQDGILRDGKLVFMFPGQGSQYIEMGKALFGAIPEFRAHFDECATHLDRELGFDFKELIFNPENKQTLEETRYTQPALFVMGVCLGRTLLDWGIQPDFLIGHSIGEFAAAHLAGVFTLEEGIRLIAARGRLMSELPRGRMLSVRGDFSKIQGIVAERVDVASINSPVHCVLAGPYDIITGVQRELEAASIVCRPLHTSHAFHSRMMDTVVEPFLAVTRSVCFQKPRFAIVSSVTGRAMSDEEALNPEYWAQHLRSTVRFSAALSRSMELGGRVFLELGPRNTLTSLAAQHLKPESPGIAIPLLGDMPDDETEVGTLGAGLAKLWASGREVPWTRIWAGGSLIDPGLNYPFDQREFRFSEGREKKSLVAAVGRETELERERQQERAVSVLEELRSLFTEFSGTRIQNVDSTFVESGYDSLVLMQIGVEIGKRYGISVSLKDLMKNLSTLNLLAARVERDSPKPRAGTAVRIALTPPSSPPAVVESSGSAEEKLALIQSQLRQMKDVLELQLRLLESDTVPSSAASSKTASFPMPGLIRAKHVPPPVEGAFQATAPDGQTRWYRYNTARQCLEIMSGNGGS